jgi:hypothetical protein
LPPTISGFESTTSSYDLSGAEGGATTGEQGAPPGAPVSVASGTAWGLAADVVTVVSGLALSVLIARYLGPTNRGVYFLVVLVATLAALAGDLGLSTSGLVFATKRALSLSHLHGGSVLASLGIGAVLAAAVLALGSWLIDSVLKGVSHGQLWLAVAGTAPLLYAQVTGSILTGLGRIPSLSVIRIATGFDHADHARDPLGHRRRHGLGAAGVADHERAARRRDRGRRGPPTRLAARSRPPRVASHVRVRPACAYRHAVAPRLPAHRRAVRQRKVRSTQCRPVLAGVAARGAHRDRRFGRLRGGREPRRVTRARCGQ